MPATGWRAPGVLVLLLSVNVSMCVWKPKESMLGRKLMIKFNVKQKPQWFKGIVNAYDGLTQKHGVYFPCDKQTVYRNAGCRKQGCPGLGHP